MDSARTFTAVIVKRQAFVAHLRAHGCKRVREGAKNSWYENPIEDRRSSVCRHTEIGDFLILKIRKDLGVPRPLTSLRRSHADRSGFLLHAGQRGHLGLQLAEFPFVGRKAGNLSL